MSKKVYVGNLSYQLSDEALAKAFSHLGKVVSARVIIDSANGRSRGFGFVEMETDVEGARALEEMNGKPVEGRPVVVRPAKELAPRARGGRGRPGKPGLRRGPSRPPGSGRQSA